MRRTAPRELEESLRRYPPIADAHVRRILPGRIEVTVEEREPDVVVRDKRGLFSRVAGRVSEWCMKCIDQGYSVQVCDR